MGTGLAAWIGGLLGSLERPNISPPYGLWRLALPGLLGRRSGKPGPTCGRWRPADSGARSRQRLGALDGTIGDLETAAEIFDQIGAPGFAVEARAELAAALTRRGLRAGTDRYAAEQLFRHSKRPAWRLA
jgi:hypothetical protein